MQNPVRSEAAAFRALLGVIAGAIVVGIAGVAGGGWVAAGVFVALLLGVAAWARWSPRRGRR